MTHLVGVLHHVAEDKLLAAGAGGRPGGADEEPAEGRGARGERLDATEHRRRLLAISRDAPALKVPGYYTTQET